MNVDAPNDAQLPNRLSTANGVGASQARQPLDRTPHHDAAATAKRVAWRPKTLAGHVCLFEEIAASAGRTLAENTLHVLANNASNSARQQRLAMFAGNLAERAKNRNMRRAAVRPGANSVYAHAFRVLRNGAASVGGAKEMNCHAGF
ncbi:hypothetical protein [Aminobacter sp. HY435]|uniref:hypothetical protein n=1 Tax=Aminobacter sp. HY435 TaxID=2970917 RepID=UPI0022B98A39|nr:hypothetical protein [Aminobacter sp. HY435]